MLCVTFYNKKIQLQLDCINSSSITAQPAEPADSMPTILCPQYFQRNITGYHSHSLCPFLGHQRSAASFAVLKHKRLNILQAVIDNLCLQKSAKHPFHICRCAPKKEEHCSPMLHWHHLHLSATDQDLSSGCIFTRGLRTARLKYAEPEKDKTREDRSSKRQRKTWEGGKLHLPRASARHCHFKASLAKYIKKLIKFDQACW